MRVKQIARGVCFWSALLAGACSQEQVPEVTPPGQSPTQIFTNGSVYTVDAENSWQQAFAVNDGAIVAIGDNDDISALAGPDTTVTDLGGRMVMPGIQDMHLHPMDGGIKGRFECVFGADADTLEIIGVVSACVDAAADDEGWIQGGQWNTNILEQDAVPTRQRLDAISKDHPIFLMDWSVHNAWVNTRALEILGITKLTPDPTGGEIVRDANGEATGILLDNAAYNARAQIPDYTGAQKKEALRYSMAQMIGFGVTSFRDAIATTTNQRAYRGLDATGEIPGRAQLSNPWKSAWSGSHDEEIASIANRADNATPRIDTRFAKIMLDGVPLTYTSAVLEPYEPSEQYGDAHFGDLMIEAEQLAEDVAYLDAQGVTIKIHATGDRAVRVALDAIAHARTVNGDSGIQHEISHAEMIHPDDIPRFVELNTAAEMCPILWYPGPAVDTMRITLGERAERFWPVKSLLDAGAEVIYGSDWPAVVPDTNPWPGIEAMVTRADPYNNTADTLWKEQAVDLATAIRIFTINGAKTGKHADTTGSLETGKQADFIVLDRNIFEVPIEEVSDVQVLHTYVAGEEVYRADTKTS